MSGDISDCYNWGIRLLGMLLNILQELSTSKMSNSQGSKTLVYPNSELQVTSGEGGVGPGDLMGNLHILQDRP
jgi:hypothetical protein